MTIYQHYREHEHPFVDRVLSQIEQVENTYTIYVTNFLNPREQQIVAQLIGRSNEEINFSFFGGREDAERKRAIIYPSFMEIEEDDFEVVALEASYMNKFTKLEHRDVLGTLASLGIDRKKLGDLIVTDGTIQIVTTQPLADFLMLNVTKIKNTTVKLQKIPFKRLHVPEDVWKEKLLTVSSLRLDVILKELHQISRKKASDYILAERVNVNFTLVTNPATLLMEGDLISVRGFGRSKLLSIEGKTKKDKIKIIAAFLV